jgi:hypothetical protein
VTVIEQGGPRPAVKRPAAAPTVVTPPAAPGRRRGTVSPPPPPAKNPARLARHERGRGRGNARRVRCSRTCWNSATGCCARDRDAVISVPCLYLRTTSSRGSRSRCAELPAGAHLIATSVVAPFMTPFSSRCSRRFILRCR